MSALPWMPLHVADYLADTAHLGATESGAYLHLIMHYWQTGGLPDEPAALARIAKVSAHSWKKLSPALQKFFYDGWKHKRIDRERDKALGISEKRRAAAEEMHRRRNANASASAEQVQRHSQSHTQEQKKEREESAALRADVPPVVSHETKPKRERAKPRAQLAEDWLLPEDFREHAVAYGFDPPKVEAMGRAFHNHHRSKGTLMADVKAAWRTWCDNEIKFDRRGPFNGHANRSSGGRSSAGTAVSGQNAVVTGVGKAFAKRFGHQPAEDGQGIRGRPDVAGEHDPDRGAEGRDRDIPAQFELVPDRNT